MDGHAVRVEVRFLPEAMLAVGAPEGAEVLVRRQVALQVAALMRAVGTEVAAVLQPALAHTAADSRGPCYARHIIIIIIININTTSRYDIHIHIHVARRQQVG